MLNYLKEEANRTHTENGALTYVSTQSDCLDLFASIGALRREEEREIVDRFLCAYDENPDLAMKTLFFARDVREGMGERRVFRVILRWLAKRHPQSAAKNIQYVAEYGRYDDLLCLLDTPCEEPVMAYIKKQLHLDLAALEKDQPVSLLAKWLPSANASSTETVRQARKIIKALGMKEAEYRRTLTALRGKIRIIENNLRELDYTFDYAQQPSKAMFKYRNAFLRHDEDRYCAFLEQVSEGKAQLHTGTLAPYEIIHPVFRGKYLSSKFVELSEEERKAIDVSWNAQEDFTQGENALVVVDGSGSMYCAGDPVPASVALSLGIYFAEHNKGAFHNHFITFSERPRLVEIKGSDIVEKVNYCAKYNEVANTNLQKVFELILNTAVKHKLPQSELPARLYIISDMEFDYCVENGSLTNFEYAGQLFARHGYQLPEVIFWNVASRNRQQPVTQNEQGVALVSGCSPHIFSMLSNGTLSPYKFMMQVLSAPRYEPIAA